jgi:pimeloyl-ACP methyl ester carboxylesterase
VTAATRHGRSVRLRARVGGYGPPVLLLHGLGGAASNWVDVAPLLVERHRVVALDLPGHGTSATSATGGSMDGFVDTVAAAMTDLQVVPALVAGHSFGGQLAVWLAARRPELVRGLLLIAPAGIGTRARRVRVAVQISTLIRPGRLVAPFGPRFARRAWFRNAVFRPFFVSDGKAISERATRGFFADMRAHTDTRAAARAMVADDVTRAFPHVRCPTLLLWGARDRQLGLEDAFAFSRGLRAQVRVVADCGHLLIGERPEAVADALSALERRS